MPDQRRKSPILLVDAEGEAARELMEFLNTNGYPGFVETSGVRAFEQVLTLKPKLVMLDISLPDINGLPICRSIRMVYTGPILILTEVSDDIEKVATLESGADNYLTKPIRPRVVLAHIRALLRRDSVSASESSILSQKSNQSRARSPEPGRDELNAGRIRISSRSRTVWLDGRPREFTSKEFDLLWYLASHAGEILGRDLLHYRIRGTEFDGVDRVVDQHICNIRRKLGDDPAAPRLIKSVRGVGYLLAR